MLVNRTLTLEHNKIQDYLLEMKNALYANSIDMFQNIVDIEVDSESNLKFFKEAVLDGEST